MTEENTSERNHAFGGSRVGSGGPAVGTDASRDPGGIARDEIYPFEFWRDIWNGRWLLARIVGAVAAASSIICLLLPNWYTAEVLLAPVENKTNVALPSVLGGLASLAGFSFGSGDATQAIAVLTSRDFARQFIREQKLLPVLFESKWDPVARRWRENDIAKPPDLRDAVRYFDRNVRSVYEDRQSRMVRLTIKWKDPDLAAMWANNLVRRLNDNMRSRVTVEAQANIDYLKSQLREPIPVEVRQAVGRLLESEMQKLMLARGRSEFAFRVIDGAEVPKRRSEPHRLIIVGAATALAALVASMALVWIANRKRRLLLNTASAEVER